MNFIPATFLRGGTSKGIFINRQHLPASESDWGPIFCRIMGSPDTKYGRQLNGMGGGVSSLSKIIVVSPASPDKAALGIHAEYTFAQIGIRDDEIDYSGNCGNLSSVVGVFAVDEGLCVPHVNSNSGEPTCTTRLWNTNTNKEICTTFPVSYRDDSPHARPSLDLEQVSIAGVSGRASQIILDFVNPGGARTGKLLPTGKTTDQITIPSVTGNKTYTVSLIDATNPSVFISSESLFGGESLPHESAYATTSTISPQQHELLNMLEQIRSAGAIAMGLDPKAKAQPKIAVLGIPCADDPLLLPEDGIPADIDVHAMSMGVLHRAIPMTVGLGLGVAAAIEGTVPHRIVSAVREARAGEHKLKLKPGFVRIRHPGGVVDVGAKFAPDGRSVTSAQVVRTGRRLMKGEVWWR